MVVNNIQWSYRSKARPIAAENRLGSRSAAMTQPGSELTTDQTLANLSNLTVDAAVAVITTQLPLVAIEATAHSLVCGAAHSEIWDTLSRGGQFKRSHSSFENAAGLKLVIGELGVGWSR